MDFYDRVKIRFEYLEDMDVEKDMCMIKDRIVLLEKRVDSLINENDGLRAILEDLCDSQHQKIRIPHRCPCCNGLTYEDDSICIPCDGSGIVWD